MLIDKTEKLSSSVDKIRVYTEIITILENDIEEACNSGYDEESWELFETISDCSSYMETAVTDILNSENQAEISSVSTWHYLLHDIYKLSGDTQKLINICYTLIKDSKTDYYEKWKALIPKENLCDEIERLLNEPKNYSYEYIISYENMSDRLYRLCCKIPSKITCYYEKLKTTEFKEQSKNLYEQYIRNDGERASNRSEYAVLCEKLKKFSMEYDFNLAVKIASDFRELYRRKPAFMDELAKAGF